MSSEPSRDDRQPHAGLTSGGVPSDRQLLETFVRRRGEAAEVAFEVLVRRHGPMVLRVTGHGSRPLRDVEDAFQATFLVLACRAQAIGRTEVLGGWLFGVARRVVLGQSRVGASSGAGASSDELHREIERLPEGERVPLVLCALGGRTVAEAAVQLQWPAGKVQDGLARAGERLGSRLERRGLDAPAALHAAFLPPLPLPESLAESALAIVRGTTAGEPAVVVATSAAVAELARPVLQSLSAASLRAMACVSLAAASLLLGAALGARQLLVDHPAGAGRVQGGPMMKGGNGKPCPCPDGKHAPAPRKPARPPGVKDVPPAGTGGVTLAE